MSKTNKKIITSTSGKKIKYEYIDVPYLLYFKIEEYCLNNQTIKNEKDKQRLLQILLELWLQIYTTVNDFISVNENDDFYGKKSKRWVNIHYAILKPYQIKINNKLIQYSELVSILKELDIIAVNDKYSNLNNFTKSYRYNDNIFAKGYHSIKLNFNKMFKNSLTKEQWLEKFPERAKLINDCYEGKIDLKGYFRWILENENEVLGDKEIKKTVKDEKGKLKFVEKTKNGKTKRKYKRYSVFVKKEGKILDEDKSYYKRIEAIKT